MATQVSFTADKELKDKALEKAKQEGITLKALLTYSMKSFVDGKISFTLITAKEEPEVEELVFEDRKLNAKMKKIVKLLKSI